MFNLAELWGYRPDGSNPCRHVPKYPEKGSTRLITDEQMVSLFAYLDKAEAEGLEHPIYLLAVRLQFEFAARMSEILLLQWDWLDLPNGRVVWPDSKTGDMSKPLSEEARRLLTNAPRYGNSPHVCPAILDHDKPLGPHSLLSGVAPNPRSRRRAEGWHPRHTPPLSDRHCQFRHPRQGRHGANRAQDRGDVHALRPHRGRPGA